MFDYKKLKNKKVTVMGLGVHGGGIGAARFFAEAGANVTVTDLKTKEELGSSLLKLKGLDIKYVLGKHRDQDFIDAELIIKNPDVPPTSPFLQTARRHHVPVDSDLGAFLALNNRPTIAVTGTKGKSTTATLVAEILRAKESDTSLVGNIGASILESLPKPGMPRTCSPIVLELSSWQLEALTLEGLNIHKKSPHIAVFTDFFPDHLNRHKTLDNYFEAKKNIYRFQKPGDFVIFNADNPRLQKEGESWKGSRVLWASIRLGVAGAYLDDDELVIDLPPENSKQGIRRVIARKSEIQLRGEHNLRNVMMAGLAAYIHGSQIETISEVVRNFKGVENRLELVRELKGVKYINDTTATVPGATQAALKSFAEPIILIAGGKSKGVSFNELAKDIVARVKGLVVFDTEDAIQLIDEIRKIDPDFNFTLAKDMRAAVRAAVDLAGPGDIVLLSPGYASFGMFRNEFDRGSRFKNCVMAL